MSSIKKRGLFGYTTQVIENRVKSAQDWFDPTFFLVPVYNTLVEEEKPKPHFGVAYGLIIIAVGLLLFRLANLQIVKGSENLYLAEGNRIRQQITLSPRGAIVDRNGISLVSNEPGYQLELIPSELPQKKQDRQAIYDQIANELHQPINDIVKQVEQIGLASVDPLLLKDNLPRDEALVYQMKFANFTGVRVVFVPSRKYDMTPGLSHILGYTSRMTESDLKKHADYPIASPIGRSGLEASYDVSLRGKTGENDVEVDATGKLQRIVQHIPPKVGDTLHLTLDKGLQQEMANALKDSMDKEKAKQAVGIAMDPRTGAILASVSLPSYDNNLFAHDIKSDDYAKLSDDPDKPLLDRATDGEYPSGSTIKPFVAAAALQEGTITPQTNIDTSAGKIKIDQWEFPDWKVHGLADVRQAIAESNDIFFYALSGGWSDKHVTGLGVARLKKNLNNFGFGKETGVDYTADASGLVPDESWKKKNYKEDWYIGDTYHMGIGQGFLLVTPLQLLRATSAIANRGTLVTPHVVESTEVSGSGQKQMLSFPTEKIPFKPEVLQIVQEGMRRTVQAGSARILNTLPFSSAGKTGTAEFGTDKKTHAWYIGYAPSENPEIAVAIIVEGGGEGNAISAPVAGRVFSYYMCHK